MVARAQAKYIRISPKKMRIVLPLVKGKNAQQAAAILHLTKKRGAQILEKVLKSAIANARNKGYDEEQLVISRLSADEGPVLKRYRAASFGRATVIRKRTSHISVELNTPENIRSKQKQGR